MRELRESIIDKLRDSVRKVSDGYGRFVVGIISPSAVKYFSGIGMEVQVPSGFIPTEF